MAKKDYGVSIDLNKNEILNARFHTLVSDPAGGVEGQYYYNSVSKLVKVHNGTVFVAIGVGSVTSVALTAPASVFSVAGSPITDAGTLAISFTTQLTNTVFAGPNGSTGVPTFRVLASADIPNLDTAKLTTGTLGVARGGTGAATLTGVVIGAGTAALTGITGTASQVLRRNVANTAYEFISPGTASTLATLDGSGKIPLTQLPDSILGQVEYIGTWNASTNTPALPAPTGVKGNFYIVTVAGTQTNANFEGGSVEYAIGDWAISNGTVWQKVDNTDAVASVFGRMGTVVAVNTDYAAFYVRHDTAAQGLNGTQQTNSRTNINAQVTITGGATTITTANLTASRALVSDASGKVAVSTTTLAELAFVSGVTSALQTQLNGKFSAPVGTTLQYLRGDGTLATFPINMTLAELTTGTSTAERLITADVLANWFVSKTFAQSVGDGTTTSFNIDHNFGTKDVSVTVYSNSTFEEWEAEVVHSTATRVIVNFNVAPTINAYRVVVKL